MEGLKARRGSAPLSATKQESVMDLNDGLYDSLKAHLDWGKPRLECFVGMIWSPKTGHLKMRALEPQSLRG